MNVSTAVFRVGTRSSSLALTQTRHALDCLADLLPGVTFEAVPQDSPGDRDRATDLREAPADFFTRDLDEAVRFGQLDAAVHSAKDVPDPVPEGLDWCWLPWHEDPRDVLILPQGKQVADLPGGVRVGISSQRREAYCRKRFPHMRSVPIRGNIEQRIQQLDDGVCDLLVMAAAALNRLGLQHRISEWIPLADLPAPDGQGVLALTFRAGDTRFQRLRSALVHAVNFVGSGPGSATLCTQAGIDALRHCEVCLFDALSDPAVLEHLPAHAERLDVGKRCGHHTVVQDDINALLARHARRGQRVVRLKGGDPGVFGRLAEEVQTLDGLGLPYRVLPGVSSLNAATTMTGLLLTRRGLSRGFTVMTPRQRGGGLAPIDSAARAALPLAFFMAVKSAGEVARELITDGRSEQEPIAFVFNAGSEEARVVRGTLGTAAELAVSAGERGPGLFLVGEVTRHEYRRATGAFAGRRVLITCSVALQERAARTVHDLGGIPVARPLIRLVPCREALPVLRKLAHFDWLVLTSPSAVRCLVAMLDSAGVDVRDIPKLLVCGSGTAAELRKHRLHANALPEADFSAQGMVELADSVLGGTERVLRLRSDQAGALVSDQLAPLCSHVEDVVLYRNIANPGDAPLPAFDAAFFASTSAVTTFVDNWGAAPLVDRLVGAIGQPTGEALRAEGIATPYISPESTVERALTRFAASLVAGELA